MTTASICTIGDEILIGQIVDTNTAMLSRAMNSLGIKITRKVSIGDSKEDIKRFLKEEFKTNDIVITTGGLGPTRDDLTKEALYELTGAESWIESPEQTEINIMILRSRGLDILDNNKMQSFVPNTATVITNRLGTAPIMAFHLPDGKSLYAMPGVPHETEGALQDVLEDIKKNYKLDNIYHSSIMTYGIAESALEKKITPWVESLPEGMHLAYLPNTLTGVRLRLSIYGAGEDAAGRISDRFDELERLLGDIVYAREDSSLENAIGALLKGTGKTLSVAESCTGGEISHLITTVPGSSEYYLGSVTSYAVPIKEKILGVNGSTIDNYGIVSSNVAAEMAEGVRRLTGSTYSVATTGWADSYGDDREPAGTVWIAVSGPKGTKTKRACYHNDRKRNIERFAATALNFLRIYILSEK